MTFIIEYLCEKEDFPDNTVQVRKGVASCLLCVRIQVSSFLHPEIIPFEYLNNRK